MEKKCLSKILWGEKGRRWKWCYSSSFQKQPSMEHSKGDQAWNIPSAIKQDVSPLTSKHWIHFKGHKTWNIPRATKFGTFHWPPSWGLPSPPSFPCSLNAQIGIIWFSIFRRDFQFKSLKTCSYNLLKKIGLEERLRNQKHIEHTSMWTMLGVRETNSPPTLLFIPFHVSRHWQTIWDNYFSPSLFKHVRGTNISQIYLRLWLLATLIYHIVFNIYIIIFNIFNIIFLERRRIINHNRWLKEG